MVSKLNLKVLKHWQFTYAIPAALNSLRFCKEARRRASSSCFSLAFRFAFFPWVFARRARASDNISNSEGNLIIV